MIYDGRYYLFCPEGLTHAPPTQSAVVLPCGSVRSPIRMLLAVRAQKHGDGSCVWTRDGRRRLEQVAIYHLEAKVVSRGVGRFAVAAAAYMSCSQMYNDYDGVQHDYTRKQGLIYERPH